MNQTLHDHHADHALLDRYRNERNAVANQLLACQDVLKEIADHRESAFIPVPEIWTKIDKALKGGAQP